MSPDDRPALSPSAERSSAPIGPTDAQRAELDAADDAWRVALAEYQRARTAYHAGRLEDEPFIAAQRAYRAALARWEAAVAPFEALRS